MRARGRGVVEQVAQLLAHVAVVDVEGGDPGPVGAQHALEVLVAVVEGQGQVVLPGLVAGQVLALGAHAEAPGVQVRAQSPGALGHLAIGEAAVLPDDALPVGQRLDQGVEGAGQVELHRGLRGGGIG